jgi:hypothetical protein
MFDRFMSWVIGPDQEGSAVSPAIIELPGRDRGREPRDREPIPAGTAVLAGDRSMELPSTHAALASLQSSATGGLRRDLARTRITEAFNAAQPVADRYALNGRYDELAHLVEAVVDGQHHAIIYGARGVGKTSLARVFGDLVDEAGGDVFYHSASGDATFEEIMSPYLRFLGEGAGQSGSPALAKAGERLSARDFAEALLGRTGGRVVLILDEFDRIVNRHTKAELAATLKLISDFRIGVQMILVGISTDIVTLIEEHASLRRHMAAVRVGPIRPSGSSGLLKDGARRAGVTFESDCHEAIVSLALGSPYHVRLLALNAALVAHRQGRTAIGVDDLLAGMDAAWRDWSTLSLPSARLFTRLATHTDNRLRLIVVALLAAQEYGFDQARLAQAMTDVLDLPPAAAESEAGSMLALLGDALEDSAGRTVFGDALAPQFHLLAMLRADRHDEGFSLSNWADAVQAANAKVTFDL